jgi:hypothetical protein
MSKKKSSQSSTVSPDAATLDFLKNARGNSQSLFDLISGGFGQTSPLLTPVLAGVNQEADLQRGALANQVNDLATKAHAFGGDRAAVLQAIGNNDINRNTMNTTSNLQYTDSMANFQRALQAIAAQAGLVPGGATTRTDTRSGGGLLQSLLGTALTVGGGLIGGPAGAAAGGAVAGTGPGDWGGSASPGSSSDVGKWW